MQKPGDALSWSASWGFSFHHLTISLCFPLHLWGQVCPGALTTRFRSLDARSPSVLFCKDWSFSFQMMILLLFWVFFIKQWQYQIAVFVFLFIFAVLCSVAKLYPTLWPHGLQPARFLCPWNFPSKNTGAGYHFLLQEIFLTQESNLHLLFLLHWQADSPLTETYPGSLFSFLLLIN